MKIYRPWQFSFVIVYCLISLGTLMVSAQIIQNQIQKLQHRQQSNIDVNKAIQIQDISKAIDKYFDTHKELPQSLEELNRLNYFPYKQTITDSESGLPFPYQPLTGALYEICTNFITDTTQSKPLPKIWLSSDNLFQHPEGFYCFTLAATTNNPSASQPSLQVNTSTHSRTMVPTPKPPASVTSSVPTKEVLVDQPYNPTINVLPTPTPATHCSSLGGKMYIAEDGTGFIGCDIKVDGAIDTASSYCHGLKSGKSIGLVPDSFGRPNQYYATLTALDPAEQVAIFAKSTSGTLLSCKPNLNE